MNPIEEQYQHFFQQWDDLGPIKIGPMASSIWRADPKSVFIKLSRYKFVSKLIQGKSKVLEIGCGDGWASALVFKEVQELCLSDMDPIWERYINDVYGGQVLFKQIDFAENSSDEVFDAVYALDVLEHVAPEKSEAFCRNMAKSLNRTGIAIVGMPSLESQVYASEVSKAGHVNCMSGPALKSHLQGHFENVFLFSMNDEVVHTGFFGMAHYLFALCVGPR